ncbi:MAG: ribonuclease HII [Oscillospiraceae bacterium]|jgi:ribonuclease HII
MAKEAPIDLWAYERAVAAEGYSLVCGVDEAGRGPLAGPVCAAAVLLPLGLDIEGLNDSKKLSPKRREALYSVIVENARTYGIAFASVAEIDALDILGATILAMSRAIEKLSPQPALALIDGNWDRGIPFSTRTRRHGDAECASIAAASILAKVTRDRLMVELDERYPEYGFAAHKGYGTRAHEAALKKYGPCEIHRHSFMKKYFSEDGKWIRN